MQDCRAQQRPQIARQTDEHDGYSNTTDVMNANGENAVRCYLLELPAELRIHIYELALKQPDIIVRTALRDKTTVELSNKHPLALTKTCKQIREECGDLFSQLNEVTLHMPRMSWLLNEVSDFDDNMAERHPDTPASFAAVDNCFAKVVFVDGVKEEADRLHALSKDGFAKRAVRALQKRDIAASR
ncbi:hypothetical protein LTR37_003570 [Vermiconidia calcicola]|uniref:Uncharacterized protein n=1 Tax=Vermiconidia calcicola TaxID=1690605 RepID=A0ACC3NQ55_9PEZI|nr:hypothetical protein LTR37_003570 [Vermiconidia calcicola]